MTEKQQTEYQSHVRGAATWILLGKSEPMMDAAELVRLYNVPLEQALADIDVIVRAEHAKSGGIFESQSPAQTLASQLSAANGAVND